MLMHTQAEDQEMIRMMEKALDSERLFNGHREIQIQQKMKSHFRENYVRKQKNSRYSGSQQ